LRSCLITISNVLETKVNTKKKSRKLKNPRSGWVRARVRRQSSRRRQRAWCAGLGCPHTHAPEAQARLPPSVSSAAVHCGNDLPHALSCILLATRRVALGLSSRACITGRASTPRRRMTMPWPSCSGDYADSSFWMAVLSRAGLAAAPDLCTGTPSLPTRYFSKFHGTGPGKTDSR